MRAMVILFLIVVVQACGKKADKANDELSAEPQITETLPIETKSEFVEEQEEISEPDSVPSVQNLWLKDSIETQFGTVQQKIVERYSINDTLNYALFTRDDKTCLVYFIATILGDSIVEEAEIGEVCDHEQSFPEFTWVEQVKDDTTALYWLEIQRYIPDSLLSEEGELPEGKFFDDFETLDDTVYWQYKIRVSDAAIISVNLSEEILQNP
jgi:hypothetical protein